jgi:hypothetical protein
MRCYPWLMPKDLRALLEEVESRMIQEALEAAGQKTIKRRRKGPGSQSPPPSSAAPAALAIEAQWPQKKI